VACIGNGRKLLAQQRDSTSSRPKEKYSYKECGLRLDEIPLRQSNAASRRFTASHADHATEPTASSFVTVIRNDAYQETAWAYDLEVEADHTYVANGLIVHNTEVCQLADGITFRKDDPRAVKLQPPLHFNCRSIDTFVTADDDVEWTSEEDLDAVVRLIMPEFK
jgi:hypothetical protein